jgi:hypothetical protein
MQSDQFREVRNKLVHGYGADDDDVLRALDSGPRILRALNAIPEEVHVVHVPNVEIFRDPKGERPFDEGHGVMLETTNTDGSVAYSVFRRRGTISKRGSVSRGSGTRGASGPRRGIATPRRVPSSTGGARAASSSGGTWRTSEACRPRAGNGVRHGPCGSRIATGAGAFGSRARSRSARPGSRRWSGRTARRARSARC